MYKTRIRLEQINKLDRRFQIRDEFGTFGDRRRQKENTQDHVKSMVEALELGKRLPQMQVTKDEDRYIIVDGFHRFEAYLQVNAQSRKRNGGKGKYYQIRVTVLETEEAAERYLTVNSEHKGLMLTSHQRKEQQWQTFLTHEIAGGRTNQELADTVGMSIRTIQNWRRYWSWIDENDLAEELRSCEVTGRPTLQSYYNWRREEAINAKHGDDYSHDEETSGGLMEADKELLANLLKLLKGAEEPRKLMDYAKHYQGWSIDEVPFDDVLELDEDYGF